nr:hypothetical protein [Lysinibacillus sphaericus]
MREALRSLELLGLIET